MPSRQLRLVGASAVERHLLMSRVVDAIEDAGGAIVEAQRYATVAATIRFEIPRDAAAGLGQALHAAGLLLDAASAAALAAVPPGAGMIRGAATVTFRDGGPGLQQRNSAALD